MNCVRSCYTVHWVVQKTSHQKNAISRQPIEILWPKLQDLKMKEFPTENSWRSLDKFKYLNILCYFAICADTSTIVRPSYQGTEPLKVPYETFCRENVRMCEWNLNGSMRSQLCMWLAFSCEGNLTQLSLITKGVNLCNMLHGCELVLRSFVSTVMILTTLMSIRIISSKMKPRSCAEWVEMRNCVFLASCWLSAVKTRKQWRFYVGARGAQAPQIWPSPPPIFGHSSSVTGWINWFYSKFRFAVVASQMMRGQAPQIFFPRTATARKHTENSNLRRGLLFLWFVSKIFWWQRMLTEEV